MNLNCDWVVITIDYNTIVIQPIVYRDPNEGKNTINHYCVS